jgi:hypothetical protein
MKEIIKRFKRLNKDSKKYLQGKRKLEERYKYLSIISPLPKEKDIKEKIFFVNKDSHILTPYQFENLYHKGEVELKCRVFNPFEFSVEFCSLTFKELSLCLEIKEKEVKERIEEAKLKQIDKMEGEINYFLKEKVIQ